MVLLQVNPLPPPLKIEYFEAIIQKQKWMSATKVIRAFWMALSVSNLEQLQIFFQR